MRIISKFHDYYDGLQDQELPLYVRNEERLEFSNTDFNLYNLDFRKYLYNFEPFPVLCFCGKTYPMYFEDLDDRDWNRVARRLNILRGYLDHQHFKVFYNVEEILMTKNQRQDFTVIFDANNYARDVRLLDLHAKIRAPVFVAYTASLDSTYWSNKGSPFKINVWKNPRLKYFGFQKVLDSQQCYQEISMFLGNTIVNPDKPDNTPDKYRIESHGFDKWNFRKMPEDKK